MTDFIDPIKIQEIKVATDAVCLGEKDGKKYILLIKREYDPFRGHWAIPGGFLKDDEELIDGAVRELREETNIKEEVRSVKEVGIFGKVGRDPRRRVISVAYLILFNNLPAISKANEALEVEWIALDRLNEIDLAFDHKEIISKALELFSNTSNTD